jgi:hypothetical protein
MLEGGVRVMIYAGDVDFICNWIGNKAWTKALPWSGETAFNAEADSTWYYTDAQNPTTAAVAGGMARTAKASKGEGSLTFLQVKYTLCLTTVVVVNVYSVNMRCAGLFCVALYALWLVATQTWFCALTLCLLCTCAWL